MERKDKLRLAGRLGRQKTRPTMTSKDALGNKLYMDDVGHRKLAADMMDGRVFGTWDIDRSEEVTMHFIALALMDDKKHRAAVAKQAHVYEYMNKASSVEVNGKPVFFSFQTIGHGDWAKVRKYYHELQQLRADFLSGRP